ncbi:MAG: hypothetical protein WAQ98_04775 [Blastocatellia bacterium]
MSKQSSQKLKDEKRVPAPKRRRDPLPIAISVKHHLPVSAEGTATDLTIAQLEINNKKQEASKLDYSTNQAKATNQVNSISPTNSISQQVKQGYPTKPINPVVSAINPGLPTTATTYSLINPTTTFVSPIATRSYEQKANTWSDRDDQFNRDDRLDHDDQEEDHFLDQLDDHDDQDNRNDQVDHFDRFADFEEDPEDFERENLPLFDNFVNKTQKQKKPKDNSLSTLDLSVQSRFVRVPNAVADKLARQLAPAEEKIFDQIWRLTIGFNRELWRGKIADLMIRTGYSSRATVTKAIAGLSALGLIAVEGRDTNPRGRSYRIIDRQQLLAEEKLSALSKDQRSNKRSSLRSNELLNDQGYKRSSDRPRVDQSKLVKSTSSQVKHPDLIKKSSTTQLNSSQVAKTKAKLLESDLVENKASKTLTQSSSQALKNNFRKKDDDFITSSSSYDANIDDEAFFQARLIYQDLTGNGWTVKDQINYQEITNIPLAYIILGICYSITKAADHKVGSLRYCVPSIREHYELMKTFPQKDLLEIAYRHLLLVKEAQRSGKWIK